MKNQNMNLQELINAIGNMAKSQQLINHSAAGASLAEINPQNIEWYPLFYVIPSGNHYVEENTTTFALTLYYMDRLLQDNSNTIDVFSSSVENLKNIIVGAKDIEGVVDVENRYTVRNFMPEKLNDRVAGAYAEVRIKVSNDTICYVPCE